MNTTLLFAELLIIGTHTALWLFLLSLNLFGFAWLPKLAMGPLADWQAVLAVLAFTVFYVFGIIVDRLADLIFAGWTTKIKRKITGDIPGLLSTKTTIFEINKDNQYLSHQFDYIRSRMRIARASAINFALCTILGLSLLLKNSAPDINVSVYVPAILIAGGLLTLGAIYAWSDLTHTFYDIIKQNYNSRVPEERVKGATVKSRKTSNTR